MALSTEHADIPFLLEAEAELADFLANGELSADAAERPRYVTNYIGSKQKLVDWIWANTPEGVETAADLFSGSSVVGYMFKRNGLGVIANDRLRYCFHIARAIVENPGEVLSEAEIDSLLAPNSKAPKFVREHFSGIYFAEGVHELIDHIRANIDGLPTQGFKRDIALFALGKSCITAKGGFGHFGTSLTHGGRQDSPEEFKARFKKNATTIGTLVFAGQRPCKAYNEGIVELLPKVEADLAYFDPPYATQFSQTNYEKAYHFIEGLMTWWEGKELNEDSKLKTYKTEHASVTRTNAGAFFEGFLNAAKHIPHWLISYRDKAFPTEPEIKKLIAGAGKAARMKSREHHYQLGAKHGEASHALERLFVCTPAEGASARAGLQLEFAELDPDEAPLSLTSACDLDLLSALAGTHAPKDGPVKVTSYMGNKYFILDFIWKHVPKGVGSVLDAFSGGANVAYFFKQKGLAVTTNDKLKYPWHIARAVVENTSERLSDDDIERLCAPNTQAGTFVADTFYGYFFTKAILQFLDSAWATAQELPGYRKDLALFALGYTCVQKARFGEFSRTKKTMRGKLADESKQDTSLGNIPIGEFLASFRRNCAKANGLVFDNGKLCKALNGEVLDAIAKSEADFIYADPPYITQFGSNDYEGKLHFVEGLMTMWADKELRDNARKDYASGTKYTKESMAALFGEMIAKAKAPILISYRDKAFPTEDEVKGMLRQRFAQVQVKGVDVEYGIAKWASEEGGKHARELLFIGTEPLAARAACERNCHTRASGVLLQESLSTDAVGKEGDKRFRFVLTHVGTNRNGDHFTAEELKRAAASAVGKKIDLAHSQEFHDIVGGIVDAEFVGEGGDARVEGVGELFTGDSESARLAYKLMKRGIVGHVSMECDYQEGECSICGKRVKSKAEYCAHLKNFKGKSYQGKPCFEILRGVTFTGVGLLDREGADAGAEISQVANHSGGKTMAAKDPGAGRKGQDQFVDEGGGGGGDGDKDALVKKLEAENAELKKQLAAAQERIQELETAQAASARKARAEQVLKQWEERGRSFDDDKARTAELERLAGLSDDAMAATEAVIQSLAKAPPEDDDEEEDDPKKKKKPKAKPPFAGKPFQKANGDPALSAAAGVIPAAVSDAKQPLAARLGAGIMSAYKQREQTTVQ